MVLPLFNLFEIVDRWPLYRALRGLGSDECWRVMSELYEIDVKEYLQDPDVLQEYQKTVTEARIFMRQATALSSRDIESMATRFGTYGPRLQFESVFLLLQMSDRAKLFDKIVDVQGRDNLVDALGMGNGVLALPVHLGPSYVICPILAHENPVTAVFNRINFDECKTLTFPNLDAEAFSLSSVNVARAGIEALKRGRIFSIFPEVDPRGVDRNHVRVPFLGTTVMAPVGPVVMSYIAKAPMVPVSLTSNNDGTFMLKYDEIIMPPKSRDEYMAIVNKLWRALNSIILNGPTEDWEIWLEFDKMLPQPSSEEM